ncbi:MAG: hypothetical protein IPG50_35875 [Myxococcales bacterium]|nr:hypothetical protein [Myxococcales bacterium]
MKTASLIFGLAMVVGCSAGADGNVDTDEGAATNASGPKGLAGDQVKVDIAVVSGAARATKSNALASADPDAGAPSAEMTECTWSLSVPTAKYNGRADADQTKMVAQLNELLRVEGNAPMSGGESAARGAACEEPATVASGAKSLYLSADFLSVAVKVDTTRAQALGSQRNLTASFKNIDLASLKPVTLRDLVGGDPTVLARSLSKIITQKGDIGPATVGEMKDWAQIAILDGEFAMTPEGLHFDFTNKMPVAIGDAVAEKQCPNARPHTCFAGYVVPWTEVGLTDAMKPRIIRTRAIQPTPAPVPTAQR